MGNWRNRRRLFYRRRSPKSPPPYSFDNEPSSSGFCDDGIPLWEKKFCALIGSVPWQKVVCTQKFIYSNNVLNWDDSAGKEAFQSAKERFWAKINGFQCDICIPDPDIYIDEIDWNPDIDSELIKDLESVYFTPDEGEKDANVGRRSKRLRYLASVRNKEYIENSGCINPWECNNDMLGGSISKDKTQSCNRWDNGNNNLKNTNDNDNPWESNITQGNDVVKDEVQSWKQWDDNNKNNDAKKLNNDDNPWECSLNQGNEAAAKNTWGNCGDKLWGWNQGLNHVNPWEQSCQGGDPVKDNRGWGDLGNNSSCWSQQKSWKLDSGDNPWKCKFSKYTWYPAYSMGHAGDREWRENQSNARNREWIDDGVNAQDRVWRNNGGDAWGVWKQRDNHGNDAKNFELGSDRNWGAWNENCRKREGSQLTSYKSSEHQPDYNPSGQCWRSRNANKRVRT